VLVDGDLEIFDSTQIFEYLEDIEPHPALWPGTAAARAWSRRLEHESDEVYFPHIIKLMQLWKTPLDPAAELARAGAAAHYRTMERVLDDREFLGGAYSFADIAFYMAQLFGARWGADMTSETPKLLQWRQRMTAKTIGIGMCNAFYFVDGRKTIQHEVFIIPCGNGPCFMTQPREPHGTISKPISDPFLLSASVLFFLLQLRLP